VNFGNYRGSLVDRNLVSVAHVISRWKHSCQGVLLVGRRREEGVGDEAKAAPSCEVALTEPSVIRPRMRIKLQGIRRYAVGEYVRAMFLENTVAHNCLFGLAAFVALSIGCLRPPYYKRGVNRQASESWDESIQAY
jgi:hypothetical protein